MTEIVVRTQRELDAALIHDTKHAFAIYLRRVEA